MAKRRGEQNPSDCLQNAWKLSENFWLIMLCTGEVVTMKDLGPAEPECPCLECSPVGIIVDRRIKFKLFRVFLPPTTT